MRSIQLGASGLTVPTVAVGCMRLTGLEKKGAEVFVKTAVDHGAVFSTTLTSTVAGGARRSSPTRSAYPRACAKR